MFGRVKKKERKEKKEEAEAAATAAATTNIVLFKVIYSGQMRQLINNGGLLLPPVGLPVIKCTLAACTHLPANSTHAGGQVGKEKKTSPDPEHHLQKVLGHRQEFFSEGTRGKHGALEEHAGAGGFQWLAAFMAINPLHTHIFTSPTASRVSHSSPALL